MDAIALLEARVASLERSLRRTRRSAVALGSGAILIAAAAFAPIGPATLAPQAPSSPAPQNQSQIATQVQEELAAQRLVLTDSAGLDGVVLLAGPESSLVIQTQDGAPVVRIGGPAMRPILH